MTTKQRTRARRKARKPVDWRKVRKVLGVLYRTVISIILLLPRLIDLYRDLEPYVRHHFG